MLEQIINYINNIPYLLEGIESVIILVIAYSINKFVVKKRLNRIAKKAKIDKHYIRPLKHLSSFIIYLIAVIAILGVFGLKGSITGFVAGAGFSGIVIGFAARDVISNFLAGFILILDKPFKIGDIVEINNVLGTVEDVAIRTTKVKTFDGEYMILPNSNVMNSAIKNWSQPDPYYRIRLKVGIDYNSDIRKALRTAKKTLESIKGIEKEREPSVLISEFGDSSINLELRFWIDLEKASYTGIKTEVSEKIKKAFDKAGIGIPFPHIELIKHKN